MCNALIDILILSYICNALLDVLSLLVWFLHETSEAWHCFDLKLTMTASPLNSTLYDPITSRRFLVTELMWILLAERIKRVFLLSLQDLYIL